MPIYRTRCAKQNAKYVQEDPHSTTNHQRRILNFHSTEESTQLDIAPLKSDTGMTAAKHTFNYFYCLVIDILIGYAESDVASGVNDGTYRT